MNYSVYLVCNILKVILIFIVSCNSVKNGLIYFYIVLCIYLYVIMYIST